MKAAGVVILAVSILWGVVLIGASIYADYEYERDIASYWSLSVKASTIAAKAEYMDKFVGTLLDAKLSGNNALMFTTPDNSYEQNLIALRTLQGRLHEISGMDVQSFQYQQAIQQITSQEQDEAHKMLTVFEGIWYKNHHFLLWEWVGFLNIIFCIVAFVIGIVVIATEFA